ncbi:MAG: hypothetical protein ACE5OQ_03625, partial [Woeseia sp.]
KDAGLKCVVEGWRVFCETARQLQARPDFSLRTAGPMSAVANEQHGPRYSDDHENADTPP